MHSGRWVDLERFEGSCLLHLQTEEDMGSLFLLNIDTYLPDYMASYLGRHSLKSPLLSPEVRRTERVIQVQVTHEDLQLPLPSLIITFCLLQKLVGIE
jgi:hypothetical protein